MNTDMVFGTCSCTDCGCKKANVLSDVYRVREYIEVVRGWRVRIATRYYNRCATCAAYECTTLTRKGRRDIKGQLRLFK